MADNGNGQAKVAVPSHVLVLTITLDQLTGALNLNGPIDNAFICYGMLELAKDAVRNKMLERNTGKVIQLAGVDQIRNV